MSQFKNPRKFAAGDRVHVQAQQIWQLLVAILISRKFEGHQAQIKVTYGDLAKAMGKPSQAGRSLIKPLWIIGEFCKDVGIPTLNSIVVNKATGIPGEHVVLSDGRSVADEMRAVNAYDWAQISPPTRGTLLVVWNTIRELELE